MLNSPRSRANAQAVAVVTVLILGLAPWAHGESRLAVSSIPYHPEPAGPCAPSVSGYVDRHGCTMGLIDEGRSAAPPSWLAIDCGGFQITFEDEVNATGAGFDEAGLGPIRRDTVCQVFSDLAAIIDLGGATPDVFVQEAETDGTGALAAASALYAPGVDCAGGAVHEHIITGVDPTPTPGVYDAMIAFVDFGDRVIGGTTVSVNSDWTVIPTTDLRYTRTQVD